MEMTSVILVRTDELASYKAPNSFLVYLHTPLHTPPLFSKPFKTFALLWNL